MQVDFTKIAMGIIAILVGVAEVYLIPWLKAKCGNEKLAKIVDTIDIFVAAAEQIAARDGYDGNWKKQHVIGMLQEAGIKVDATVDEYIEAAVISLHSQLVSEE